MLAAFGVLESQPDHADRAVRTARLMNESLLEINALRDENSQDTIEIGIGIHSGRLVAGCLDGANRLEFTIIGDTVNMASRIEGLTKELGEPILMSEATRSLLRDEDKTVEIGPTVIRGVKNEVKISALQMGSIRDQIR